MAILKPKATDKTRTLSVRIPVELFAQIDALRNDAEQAGLVFDAADIVSKSLAVAVKTARVELSAICVQHADSNAPSAPSSLAPHARDGIRRDDGGTNDRRE